MHESADTIVIPADIMRAFEAYQGTSYAEMNCWQFVRAMYKDGLGLEYPLHQQYVSKDFIEIWYGAPDSNERVPQHVPQPYDLALFEMPRGLPHVGLIGADGVLLHSTETQGVHGEHFERYRGYMMQLSRPRILCQKALPFCTPVTAEPHDPDRVLVRVLRSPILSQNGHFRERQYLYDPGLSIAQLMPDRPEPFVVWHNGVLLDDSATWADCWPRAGDEVVLSSCWGEATTIVGLIISITLSIIIQGVTASLAPGLRQRSADDETERTQTFTGIRSTNVPGGVVPIIYGRHRVGMTRLAESVEYQGVTAVDRAPTDPYTIQLALGGIHRDPPQSPPPQTGPPAPPPPPFQEPIPDDTHIVNPVDPIFGPPGVV